MSKNKPQVITPSKSTEDKVPNEQAIQFLLKEYDALKDLLTQAESTVQGIFNFYLTLLTTIFGAVVIVLQLSASDPTGKQQAQLIISTLLVFVAGVGSVYLSSLSGRYAHITRYAQGIDEIRRYLIDRLNIPLPPIYKAFMTIAETQKRITAKKQPWAWLLTTLGTYQIFVGLINSLSLSMASWLFLSAAGLTNVQFWRSIVATLVVFLITFTIYNIYPRFIMRMLVSRLNVQIDVQHDFPFLAGKL